jgi:hypothetical protein
VVCLYPAAVANAKFASEESPSGMLARSGSYTVRSRVIDDDNHVWLDFEWGEWHHDACADDSFQTREGVVGQVYTGIPPPVGEAHPDCRTNLSDQHIPKSHESGSFPRCRCVTNHASIRRNERVMCLCLEYEVAELIPSATL